MAETAVFFAWKAGIGSKGVHRGFKNIDFFKNFLVSGFADRFATLSVIKFNV